MPNPKPRLSLDTWAVVLSLTLPLILVAASSERNFHEHRRFAS